MNIQPIADILEMVQQFLFHNHDSSRILSLFLQQVDGSDKPLRYWTRVQQAVFRIHDILVWIRIRIHGSMPLTNGSGSGSWILDPDPAIFVIDLQDASKKLIF
jgi:hypothetical protein